MRGGFRPKPPGPWMAASLLALALALAWPAWSVGAERTLGLGQVVRLAVERNPDIRAAEAGVGQAEARLTQARAPYWPQVVGRAGYQHQYDDATDRSLTSASRSGSSDQYTTGMGLTQMLYDFGRTGGEVDRRQYGLAASGQDLASVLAEVVLAARLTYFEVLKNSRLVEVAAETLRSQERHLVQARGFHRAGVRPKIDVTRAEVDVANARLGMIQANYGYRLARVNLEKVLGGPPGPGPYALEDVSDLPPRPRDLAPLTAEAVKARPEARSLEAQIEAARGQLTAAGGGWWPSLEATGDYQYASAGFPLREYWEVGAGLSWPLFSGWRTSGEESEARALIRQLQARLHGQRLAVEQEVSAAFLNLSESSERIETARLALRQARENMTLAEGRYRAGVGDAIEYTDAQLTLTQAENQVVQSTYGYLQAFARLDRAVGRAPLPPPPQAQAATPPDARAD